MRPTYILTFLAFIFGNLALGQNSAVKLESNLVENQILCIVTITGGNLYEVSEFPDIRFLEKEAKSIKHGTVVIAGKKELQHTITQVYNIIQSNRIQFPSFEIYVNDKPFKFESKTYNIQSENLSIPDIEEVELVLETDKTSLFLNEGVNVLLKLYISETTTTQFQFPDNLSSQVEQIAKQLKPKDCLESRMSISNIVGKKENKNGKLYNVYTLLETNYFPLNTSDIQFPVTIIKMEKNKQEKITEALFKSKPDKIKVKDLPNHPLKETIAVGDFTMTESTKGGKNKAIGVAFDYELIVEGNTDMKNVNVNFTQGPSDIFLANTESNQLPGEKNGKKIFKFKIVPKTLGKLSLKDQLNFIFFNTSKSQYDTIFAKKSFTISGDKIDIDTDEDIFFNIEDLDTSGFFLNKKLIFRILSNVVWSLIAVSFLILIFKKPK